MSRTSKEDLIKAIDISISKVPLKCAEYVPELWQLCMKFINSFEISNVLQFDIDIRDAALIYCNPYLFPYKYKQFVKDKLDAVVRTGTIEGPIKELYRWRFPV